MSDKPHWSDDYDQTESDETLTPPLGDLLAHYLMHSTANHIEQSASRNARFMEAVRKVDEMEDKIEIARVIRAAWGPFTYETEEPSR